MNCNVAFIKGKAAIGLAVRDDTSLLVRAFLKLIICHSAAEAEAKALL